MRKILIVGAGCLGVALALMLGSGVAVASVEQVWYESAYVMAESAALSAGGEMVASVEHQAAAEVHRFAVASNFRKESAGMVMLSVMSEPDTGGHGTTGPYR